MLADLLLHAGDGLRLRVPGELGAQSSETGSGYSRSTRTIAMSVAADVGRSPARS